MGQTALLPLRRKACWGFFRPEKSKGFGWVESANLGTKGQHATSIPPKPHTSLLNIIYICSILILYPSDLDGETSNGLEPGEHWNLQLDSLLMYERYAFFVMLINVTNPYVSNQHSCKWKAFYSSWPKYNDLKEVHLEGRDAVVQEGFDFPLSVSLHQCSLLIFVWIIRLSEGQESEAWKPLDKAMLFPVNWKWVEKYMN